MKNLDASEVAALLAEYGRRSALRGGNPYRAKAYLKAAENLLGLGEPLGRVAGKGGDSSSASADKGGNDKGGNDKGGGGGKGGK